MASTLEQRLKECNERLMALYIKERHDQSLLIRLNDIQMYYELSLKRSKYRGEAILSSYKLFVDCLIQVKEGTLSAKEALKKMDENTLDRKIGIIFYNIAKSLELAFWMATTYYFCSVCLFAGVIAAPSALLGVALFIVAGLLMLKAAENFGKCIGEFKSFTRLYREDERERNVISFFTPIANQQLSELEDHCILVH